MPRRACGPSGQKKIIPFLVTRYHPQAGGWEPRCGWGSSVFIRKRLFPKEPCGFQSWLNYTREFLRHFLPVLGLEPRATPSPPARWLVRRRLFPQGLKSTLDPPVTSCFLSPRAPQALVEMGLGPQRVPSLGLTVACRRLASEEAEPSAQKCTPTLQPGFGTGCPRPPLLSPRAGRFTLGLWRPQGWALRELCGGMWATSTRGRGCSSPHLTLQFIGDMYI